MLVPEENQRLLEKSFLLVIMVTNDAQQSSWTVGCRVESRFARFTLRPYAQAGSSLCSNSAITPFEYESKECMASLPTQRFEPILEVNMPDQLNKSVQAFHAGFSRS